MRPVVEMRIFFLIFLFYYASIVNSNSTHIGSLLRIDANYVLLMIIRT